MTNGISSLCSRVVFTLVFRLRFGNPLYMCFPLARGQCKKDKKIRFTCVSRLRASVDMKVFKPRILRFESLPSTNTELAREASAGAAEGLTIVADEQTAGRGRL